MNFQVQNVPLLLFPKLLTGANWQTLIIKHLVSKSKLTNLGLKSITNSVARKQLQDLVKSSLEEGLTIRNTRT